MSNRASMFRNMQASDRYDLIVIGGGITGCGVAYEAAVRGARVLLLEQHDFASGTSSRSTKLIHGGIRYLKHADFRLVREGVTERQDLIEAAPHLVRPVQFLYPVHEGDPDPLWALRIGLVLYDWFAGRRNLLRHKVLDIRGVGETVPQLATEGLKGGALYADCITDDARLTVEVAKAAARNGAILVNYMAVERFLYDSAGKVVGVEAADNLGSGGERFSFYAPAILNATGPWVDRIRQLDQADARPVLRPTKGVHVTVPHSRLPIDRPVVMHGADRRMMFAVPRDGFTYLGTTDTDSRQDPAGITADRADVTYILNAANRMFPGTRLTDDDVVSTWAGLRTLAAASETAGPSQVSRDYRLHTSPSGVVSVAGGKLTAFQAMARSIVRHLLPQLDPRPLPLELAAAQAVPTAAQTEALAAEHGLTAAEVQELWFRHGAETDQVLALLPPKDPTATSRTRLLSAEAAFAVTHEFAATLTDALHRRMAQMLFSSDNGLQSAGPAAGAMGALLGWSGAEQAAQVEAYRGEAATMFGWRDEK